MCLVSNKVSWEVATPWQVRLVDVMHSLDIPIVFLVRLSIWSKLLLSVLGQGIAEKHLSTRFTFQGQNLQGKQLWMLQPVLILALSLSVRRYDARGRMQATSHDELSLCMTDVMLQNCVVVGGQNEMMQVGVTRLLAAKVVVFPCFPCIGIQVRPFSSSNRVRSCLLRDFRVSTIVNVTERNGWRCVMEFFVSDRRATITLLGVQVPLRPLEAATIHAATCSPCYTRVTLSDSGMSGKR